MMIQKVTGKANIVKALADYLMDEKTYKELGEPLIYKEGMEFFVFVHKYTVVGFIGYYFKKNHCFLNYAYVFEGMRGKNIFSKLYDAFENEVKSQTNEIKLTATDSALHMYLNKGYEIKKSWTNYHNLFKTLNDE